MAQSPFQRISYLPESLPILHLQLYNECAFISSPQIACWAADQSITVMIDLYKRRTTAVTVAEHGLRIF
jgi:hypothetical protein